MHFKIFAAVAGVSFAVASGGTQAMPAGSVASASSQSHITLAAAGCGVGFAPGPAGVCRPIRRGPVVVVAPRRVVVAPRVVRPRCGVRVPGVALVTPC